MSSGCSGRCLCGNVSYNTGSDPLWVTVCYCRFCQRATGSDRMIEPIFERDSFTFSGENPSIYTLPSEGSGKDVNVHFCDRCGTKLALTFERWPDRIGIYVGTLDDPVSIMATPENSKHIFVSEPVPGRFCHQVSRLLIATPPKTMAHRLSRQFIPHHISLRTDAHCTVPCAQPGRCGQLTITP